MGPLPAAGQWVRLEVPASQVGLEGKTLNGMGFTLYGGRATWDKAGKSSAGANIQWLVSDQLGTPRMVVDETGSLSGVKRHDYLPFGEEVGAGIGGRIQQQGYGQVDDVRQQFTGYERDDEAGLDYAQARYYGSMQGRFTSPDDFFNDAYPSNPQSWNLYAYVRNNPMTSVDPTGMWTDFIDPDGNRTHIEDGRDQVIAAGSKLIKSLQNEFETNKLNYSWIVGSLAESNANLRMTTAQFDDLAAVIYAETSNTATAGEAAAIHGVLRNRANAEGTSALEQANDTSQVFGAKEKHKISDPNASASKRNEVYAGIAISVTSGNDLSNGAYYWHGTDFRRPTPGSHAHEAFYLSGFQFTNKKHDMWNLGDHKSGIMTYDYKYESTAAHGKTTFMRLTTAWMKANRANTWRGKTK